MPFPLRPSGRASFPLHSFPRRASFCACAMLAVALLAGCGFGTPATSASSNAPGAVAAPTQRPTYIFVAIGASETFGTGADRPATQNWPTDLGMRMQKGTQVINLGIPGITAPEALQNELPEALDARPNLVTVWLGTNDIVDQVSLGEYQQSLDSILTQLQQSGAQHVAVANIPDLNLLPRFNGYDQMSLAALVAQWNKVVLQEIKAHNDILLDVYGHTSEVLGNPDYLSGDGLHPSTLGYEQIANYFYQVLHMNGVI